MPEHAAQSIVHGIVASACVQCFIALSRLERPDQRLRLRLLALAFPVLLAPALALLAPGRTSEAFAEERAWFATRRLGELRLAGLGADAWLFGSLSALGAALLLRDLLPFAVERAAARARERTGRSPARGELQALVERAARAAGLGRVPELAVLDSDSPALFCTGLRRPSIAVSRRTLEQLDPAQLEAGLAHELAHLRCRDPLLGWLLMAARTLLFFNPAVQVTARACVAEMERRADELAARATGDRLALASGLLRSFRGGAAPPVRGAWPIPGLEGAQGLLRRFRAEALQERCLRLLEPRATPGLAREGLHLLALGTGLGCLLFLVV